jgi:hypothetical protein
VKQDDRYPTVTDLLREYGNEVDLTGTRREQYAENAFDALRDLLAACDAALPEGRAARQVLTVKQIRTLIRENIRKAS